MRTFVRALAPDITATWEIQKPDPHYSSVFTEGTVEKEAYVVEPRRVTLRMALDDANAHCPFPYSEPRWMKAMVDFAEFLKQAHLYANVPAIKIAVIDDGIDTALDDFTGKIQVGESFYRLSELTGRRGAYYVPSGPHGTLMAQLICKVCPVVKLYIAQLEVLPGQDGRRSFTVESASEVRNGEIPLPP